MADFASESGHWYAPNGEPRYTILAKNGIERATTLRDARKEGWYPSVTGIIRCAAVPGLEKWKRKQLGLALLTLPRLPDETEDAFLLRAEKDAEEQALKAREKGTEIHGYLESYFRDQAVPGIPTAYDHIHGCAKLLLAEVGKQEWRVERSYAHALGYGCKIDLHSAEWVIDYKSKEFTLAQADDLVTYDEHHMQLAANRRAAGIPKARCAIVFVSQSEAGLSVFRPVCEDDLVRGLAMFDALHAYWKAANRYDPAALQKKAA